MFHLNSSFSLRTLRKYFAWRLLLVLFVIGFGAFVTQYNSALMAPENSPASVLKTTTIVVEGPGACYVAKVEDTLKLWTLTDSRAKLAGEIPLEGNPIVDITLTSGVSAIFYSNELPLGDQLHLRFNGALVNEKCPTCRVAMPLNSADWANSFGASTDEVKVSGNEGLTVLVQQQNQIFEKARAVSAQLAEAEAQYIEGQKNDLRDAYSQMKSATDAGVQLLNKSEAETMAFAGPLQNQAGQDTGAVKNAADKYANFLLNLTVKFQGAARCANLESYWKLEQGLERDLRIGNYPDPLPEDFDEETFLPLNRDAIVSQYENSNFPKLANQIRPCIMGLLGGLNLEIEDVNFPGSIPNLSKEALVSPAAYDTIGNNASEFVDRTDVAATAFETSQTANFAQLDKLAQYRQFEKDMTSLAQPLLDHVGKSWLQDDPPNTNNAALSTAKQSSTGSKSILPSTSQCGQDPVVSFNISGVSVLIGTPWDDEVTADDGKNLIITLRGDDCINAKDGMDAVFAMNGADIIDGGDGHGFLFGGRGPDTITGGKGESYEVTIGTVTLKFDIGGFISGGAGDDTLDGSENKTLDLFGYTDVILGDGLASDGDSGADVIDGMKGINFIFGQGKNDTLKTTGFGRVRINGVPMPFGSFFWGGLGDDVVTGTDTPLLSQSFGDFIAAGSGNDNVSAGNGRDFAFGETGNDQLNGNENDDFLFGGPGTDTIHGNGGRELIAGGPDNDTLHADAGAFALMLGNGGTDLLRGGPGIDLELGKDGADEMYGNVGPIDLLAGMEGSDTINGEQGIDLILGGRGDDKIKAGDGFVDLVLAGEGFDFVEGGLGPDVIFGMSNTVQDQPLQVCPSFNGDVEKLFGNEGIDLIWGNSGCDAINGGPGVDALFGGGGSDLLEGDDGSDFIWGAESKDTINAGDGIDIAFGGPGDDQIRGLTGIDLLVGGTGDDHVWGGNGADILIGYDGKDTLEGEADPNLLIGGNDTDLLLGGSTIDLAFGGKQSDTIKGGAGLNVLFGDADDDQITGGNNTDIAFGDDGSDQIDGGAGSNLLFGNDGNDNVTGQGDFDIIFGGPGADSVNGGGGNNLLFGNAGDDNINAESGRNLAFGGAGDDTMTGGCNSESPRDYLFGNGGSNSLEGNKTNDRDILVGGNKNRC